MRFCSLQGKRFISPMRLKEKCKFVLRIANLEAFVVNKAGVSLTEAFASIAKNKMLHSTLVDLGKFPQVTPDDLAALEKAKDGRNFIAHEGALFGMVWLARKREIEEHVEKLRNAVRALAEGDNVVSGWVYEIEEKERPRSCSSQGIQIWSNHGSLIILFNPSIASPSII